MTMLQSLLNSFGSSPRMLVDMGFAYLASLMRLLVLGVQLESWWVTFILDELIYGSASWLVRVSNF